VKVQGGAKQTATNVQWLHYVHEAENKFQKQRAEIVAMSTIK